MYILRCGTPKEHFKRCAIEDVGEGVQYAKRALEPGLECLHPLKTRTRVQSVPKRPTVLPRAFTKCFHTVVNPVAGQTSADCH